MFVVVVMVVRRLLLGGGRCSFGVNHPPAGFARALVLGANEPAVQGQVVPDRVLEEK